ncbi:MAG TPA: hypothetical protein VFR23_04200 [Jiangellaceae bacterium]|nr:hypothetical protein [Jiangellaceae bacterium]
MADSLSPPPEVSPNQDPYAQIAELAADRVFTHWRDQLHQMNAHEFELALLTAALDAVSEVRPAIFAAGVAAGRTQAATEIAEELWQKAQRMRGEDFRAGRVGIEYINGYEDAAAYAERVAGELPEGQENT